MASVTMRSLRRRIIGLLMLGCGIRPFPAVSRKWFSRRAGGGEARCGPLLLALLLLGGLEGLDEGLGLLGVDLGGEAMDLAPADPGPLGAEVAAELVLIDPGGLCEIRGRLDGLGGSDEATLLYIEVLILDKR